MKITNVNWDDVATGEVIPEGSYMARIDKVETRKSQQDKAYLGINFVIVEGDQEGRVVWQSISLEPRALWKLRQLLEALGHDLVGMQEVDTDDLLGQEVGINVTHEEYEGQVRHRVNSFFAATGANSSKDVPF